VDDQATDPHSTLALYRSLLAARRALDPTEPLAWVLPDSDELVAFRRGELVVLLNVTDHAVEVPAQLGNELRVVRSSARDHVDATSVASNACVWLRPA
jgi:alpha-glucosidase